MSALSVVFIKASVFLEFCSLEWRASDFAFGMPLDSFP